MAVPGAKLPFKGPKQVGILGIERKMQQQNKETSQNISQAFNDLGELMKKVMIIDLRGPHATYPFN